MSENTDRNFIAGRYAALQTDREIYLSRAKECARLTIPSIMPETRGSAQQLPTPWQSIGARGTNNLASKLLLALLPPNSPFFRLAVDDVTLEELAQSPQAKTDFEEALSKIERVVMQDIESDGDRVKIFEALKNLIIAGNVLMHITDDGLRIYQLDRYVVSRDSSGNLLELITEESIAHASLPENLRKMVVTEKAASVSPLEEESILHTRVVADTETNKYLVTQEVAGIPVPEAEGSFKAENLPYVALRLTSIDGESYGRSYVEEYYGDLMALEKLTKAVVEGATAAAKVLFLVDPNGTTRQSTIARAPNGAIREGSANDITVMRMEKANDFSVAQNSSQQIEERLAAAFLLNTSVQRGGDRVTATEIRYVAGELEDALGGVYSLLSQEMQLPYVTVKMKQMQKAKRLPKLPEGVVMPTITTGLEALGRGHDLQKLDLYLQGIAQTLGPDALAQYVNVSDYLTRRATAIGIDPKGLIKTAEEREAEQQQVQMAQMAQQLGPEALKQMGQAQTQGDQ